MSTPANFKGCPSCGAAAPITADHCSSCGYRFIPVSSPPPGSHVPTYGSPDSGKLAVTLILWFFLGGLGIHRIYLGHIGTGITILILFLVSIPLMCLCYIGLIPLIAVCIWWFVDLILILTGALKPTDGTRLI